MSCHSDVTSIHGDQISEVYDVPMGKENFGTYFCVLMYEYNINYMNA
jgi:hypothetical protein